MGAAFQIVGLSYVFLCTTAPVMVLPREREREIRGRKPVGEGVKDNATQFLDASTHLYKSVCLLVCLSVGPSVRGPSRVFFKSWKSFENSIESLKRDP